MSAELSKPDARPLIAHVVYRFDYGGLENGVVNLINGLPAELFRHAVIAMTDASDFRLRIRKADVDVHTLHKKQGKDLGAYLRLFRLLRKLQPTIVHTRNLGALDAALVAKLAGVKACIHGEHGWDTYDPDGTNRKYRMLRRALNPAIAKFVTVSRELQQWLQETVGIEPAKIIRICNGVDTERFCPGRSEAKAVLPSDRFQEGTFVVGSVTRFTEIKDPLNLVRAFIEARARPDGQKLRLLMIGDGPLREPALRMLGEAGLEAHAWLPGSREDIPQLLRAMDLFVLGSRREGISNTVLEAMASGLPVIATATGGNFELVAPNVTGVLVGSGDFRAIAKTMLDYANNPELRSRQSQAARDRAERDFSLRRMLSDYAGLYCAFSGDFEEAANVRHYGNC
jgi:sugar transferase (PEP-CTERM/EpsH1 system associated)